MKVNTALSEISNSMVHRAAEKGDELLQDLEKMRKFRLQGGKRSHGNEKW